MKKLVISIILVAGIAAIAIASLTTNKKKAETEKKVEKKERKCFHTCPFS